MEGCSIAPIPDLLMKHGDVTLDARLVFSGWAKTTVVTSRGLVSRPRASGSVLRAHVLASLSWQHRAAAGRGPYEESQATRAADCAAIPRSDDCFDPPQGVSPKVGRGHIEFVLRCGAADLYAAGHLAAPTTAIANAQPSHGPRQ